MGHRQTSQIAYYEFWGLLWLRVAGSVTSDTPPREQGYCMVTGMAF